MPPEPTSYDVLVLARAIGQRAGWRLLEVRFSTGMPDASDDPVRHDFWNHKFAMGVAQGARRGPAGGPNMVTFSRYQVVTKVSLTRGHLGPSVVA